jgi:hypothetical protein
MKQISALLELITCSKMKIMCHIQSYIKNAKLKTRVLDQLQRTLIFRHERTL